MDIDSALLRTLLVLADELHFGRAADRLNISQQALSKRVARLEAAFSTPLVDRSDRRHVRLTSLGQDILPLAREVVESVDRLDSRTSKRSDRLRLDIMGDYLAPQRWSHLAAKSSGLPIDVVQRPPATTADHMIITGQADFAFGRAGAVPRPWAPHLRQRLMLLEPLALLVAASHPWAGRDHIAISELAGQRLWFPLAAAPVEWCTYLAEFSDAFGVDFETTGSTFGYQQWMDDVACQRVPPSIVGEAMAPTNVKIATVSITDPTPVFPWFLLWSDTTAQSLVEELLVAMGFPNRTAHANDGIWIPASDTSFVDCDADNAER